MPIYYSLTKIFTEIKVKQNVSQQLRRQKYFIISALFQRPRQAVLLTAFDEPQCHVTQ